jgi:putative nucleotidyltransferase with HDIG domain
MKLGLEFFRSKVAQRIFLLFISSALIPVAILAIIHYRIVITEIYRQDQRQIHEISKSYLMDINQRLMLVREDMEMIASLSTSESLAVLQSLPEKFSDRFQKRLKGLVIETDKGDRELLMGSSFEPPELNPVEEERIISGEFLIKTEYHPENQSHIFMSMALNPERKKGGILWADVNPNFLWFEGTDYPLPAYTDLSILNQSNNPLLSTLDPPLSFSEEAILQMAEGYTSQFEWMHSGKTYLADYRPVALTDYRPVSLKNQYPAENWKIVLSMNKDKIVPFTVRFLKILFPLVILASFWLVLFLSTIQIRKSLIPLEKIKEGTQRIANRDFDTRVKVTSRDEFEEVAESFNAMARQLGRQFKTLTTMVEIDRAILSVLDTDKIVNTVLTRMSEVFPSKSVSMAVIDTNPGDTAQTYIREGKSDKVKPTEKIQISPEELQMLRNNPETLMIKKDENLPRYLVPLTKRGIKSFLVLPIFLKLRLAGIISFGYAKQPRLSQEDLDQARQLADQVAVAFSNARLIEELNELNWGTLTALARAIDAKSPWTAGHSEQSTKLAVRIGEAMKLSHEDIDDLNRGGLLHDIGKLGIPINILDKPGKLTFEETKTMQKHVRLGARILEPITAYEKIIPIVLQHHERFNGKGYPDGLKGDSINLSARIFAVADSYEAMTADRPYRKAFDRNSAMGIIKENSGSDFDPHVVNAFLEVMDQEAQQ